MKIEVYIADTKDLEDEALYRRICRSLPADRREKADRQKTARGKQHTVGAGALLHAALASEGIRSYEAALGENGKPFLKGEPSVRFNLSHSGERVMCAVSGSDIGCDVEQIASPDLRVAKRFFCPEEYEAIRRCPDETEQARLFYRYWTLKESFIKAAGLGLAIPLNEFCIRIGSRSGTPRVQTAAGSSLREPAPAETELRLCPETISVRFRPEHTAIPRTLSEQSCEFRELNLRDGYCYALCSIGSPIGNVVLQTLCFKDIAASFS